MHGKTRASTLMLAATLTLAPVGAFAADPGYVTPSLVRIHLTDSAQPVVDGIFEAGWDVVARGKGWIDALVPREQALQGLAGLGLADSAALRLEIRRQDADSELEAFRGRDDAGAYHTYAEVQAEIDGYAAAHPEILTKEIIGTTVEGRGIVAVRITGPGNAAERPAQLITGLHHSREWISVEVPMALVKMLVEGYAADPAIRALVDGRRIWVIPVVNPDGLIYSQTEYKMWRKNRATNEDGSRGVDPNRNYGYNWGLPGASPSPGSETYRGPAAFSEPEIQAVRDLGIREGFASAVSFHSYSELVLWPWGYTYDPAPDDDVLGFHGRKMAAFNGYTPEQSSDLYPTSGDFDDWFYGDQGTLAYTFELGTQFVPPETQIPGIVADNLKAMRYFLENCSDPFPLLTHSPRQATTDTAGPYGVELRLSRRYQAADPVHHAEVVYLLPGADEWARAPLTKGADGTMTGAIPGSQSYGDVQYHFEAALKDAQDPEQPGEAVRVPAEGEHAFPVVEQLYLLVDDDAGKTFEVAYAQALEALALPYQVRGAEVLTSADLLGASAVIWLCGNDSSNTLTASEQALLQGYLDAGGELALFGQDIGYDIKGDAFYAQHLKAAFVKDKSSSNDLAGEDGGPLAGWTGTINSGDGAKQAYPEVVAAADGGAPLFRYGSGEVGGVAVAGSYRVAYFGVGLEGVDGAEARAAVLGKTLTWLGQDSGLRKARRARTLRGQDGASAATVRLEAEVVDAARRLGRRGARGELEALLRQAARELRNPLLRAFYDQAGR